MLIMLVLNVIVLGIGAIFVWLPEVHVLPHIIGYDIDTALLTGMGYVNRVFDSIWPLWYVFQGMLYVMIYYTIKMALRLLLGHRAP